MKEDKCKHILKDEMSGDVTVTVISYDLNTAHDPNINAEFKDWLIDNGWKKDIPEVKIRRFSIQDTCEARELPETTLWKKNITPDDAVLEFERCAMAYKSKHVSDSLIAYGKVVAFCVNTYAALSIE